MVVGKSPDWLPSGFSLKVKYKNGRRIKYYYNVATGIKYYSKNDVLSCARADNGLIVTPQNSKVEDSGLSSDSKVDARVVETDASPKWLPDGWTTEERTRYSGSRKGSTYKVYIDGSSGKRFYSRAAVTQYLNSVDHANTMTVQTEVDKVDEPSPKCLSMTDMGGVPEEEKDNSFEMLDKVGEPSPKFQSMTNKGGIPEEGRDSSSKKIDKVVDPSPQSLSMKKTGSIPREKKKGNPFKPVNIESSAADDLPPGWIKEIITSKSGKKIRKDPFYTDPVSGYVFRSKLDAFRYLETNDIRSCAMRPKKREPGDLNLLKSEIPSPSPAQEKLPEHKGQLFVGGESNGWGESSGTNFLADSGANISKQTIGNNNSVSVKVTSAGADCLEEKMSYENPLKITELQNNPEPENGVSKEECGIEKQTEKTLVKSKNSRKRKVSSLPSRTSKRLARNEPETPSNSVLNERSLRAATKRSPGSEIDASPNISLKSASSVPMPSDTEPAKEASSDHATAQVGDTLNEIEPPNEVENPPNENPIIPEDQTNGNANENQLDDDSKRSQESQFCYDFGDSWSDPLEFALKTLRGEIPLDDNLQFSGCFNEPYNSKVDGCSTRPSQSDVSNIFQNEVAPNIGSTRQTNAVESSPASSSSFSALGNIGFPSFSGFNNQSTTDAGKNDRQTKFNP